MNWSSTALEEDLAVMREGLYLVIIPIASLESPDSPTARYDSRITESQRIYGRTKVTAGLSIDKNLI
jgi:hypothetical protein